jgi:hypothetical protein
MLLLWLCVAVVLLLPPLLAGLGGVGRGWREAARLVFGFALSCFSLPCRPAVAARGRERGAVARVFPLFLNGSCFSVLFGCMFFWQPGCCFTEPSFYARLLLPVAGAGVLTAGLFSLSAAVEWCPLFLVSGIAGVGSPLS